MEYPSPEAVSLRSLRRLERRRARGRGKKLGTKLLAGSMALSVGAALAPARAQEASGSSGDSYTLEELTVEARRFDEKAIDVPVAISVVTGQELSSERVTVLQDLGDRVPNFLVPDYGGDPRTAQPIIRGIGTLSTLLSPDNATAPTILDGVPMPAFAANSQLLDIGQVEILRGPQGTLFGRNSTGGAINVISVLPDGQNSGQVTAEVGTEDALKGEMVFGGGLGEKVYGRISARYQRLGSYVPNDHPLQDDIGAFDVGAFKSSFRWLASETSEIRVNAGFERYNGDDGYPYLLRDSHAYQQTPTFQRNLYYLTVNGSFDLENAVVKTVSGFTYYDIYNWTDNSDGYVNSATYGAYGLNIPPTFWTFDGNVNVTNQDESQFYQEVRLQSRDDAVTKWVLGAVFSYNDFTENVDGTSTMSASINGQRDVNLKSTSAAAFFDVTQPFAERFEVSLGGRYTYDHKSIDATYLSDGAMGTVPYYAQNASTDFNLFSGRLTLSYKPNDDTLLYGSISRGTKSGGYPRFTGNAAIGEPEDPYDATTVWAYELGAKAELRDTGTSVTGALFYNDVSDEAIFGYDAVTMTFPIENFDIATYGFEAEIHQKLMYGFGLSGGIAITHAEITGVPTDSVLVAEVGNEVPNVPLWSGNIRLTYENSASFLGLPESSRLAGYVAYRYIGERAGDVGNNFDLDPLHIIDARLGVKVDKVEVYAFGQNLVGELLEQQGANMTGSINSVVVSRGRVLGLGLTSVF